MMKIALLLLAGSTVVFGQTAAPRTFELHSPDSSFSLTLSGRFYEGFSGIQSFTFRNAAQRTLWQKAFAGDGLAFPAVSNRGQVAITHGHEVQLFDSSGTLAGALQLAPGREIPFDRSDEGTHLVQGFSPGGHRYFLVTQPVNRRTRFLLCVDDSARTMWKKALENLRPAELLCYKDLIIMHDFFEVRAGHTNSCTVLDREGNVLWRTDIRLRRPLEANRVRIHASTGRLEIIGPASSETVDLNKLAPAEAQQ